MPFKVGTLGDVLPNVIVDVEQRHFTSPVSEVKYSVEIHHMLLSRVAAVTALKMTTMMSFWAISPYFSRLVTSFMRGISTIHGRDGLNMTYQEDWIQPDGLDQVEQCSTSQVCVFRGLWEVHWVQSRRKFGERTFRERSEISESQIWTDMEGWRSSRLSHLWGTFSASLF